MVAVSCRWCCGCSGAARRGCPFWCVPARWAGRIGRGPPRALWRGPGEGRWVTLGGVVLTVNGDRGVVERQLSGGELVCPSCGGVLGGWGHGVDRGVRVLGGPAAAGGWGGGGRGGAGGGGGGGGVPGEGGDAGPAWGDGAGVAAPVRGAGRGGAGVLHGAAGRDGTGSGDAGRGGQRDRGGGVGGRGGCCSGR